MAFWVSESSVAIRRVRSYITANAPPTYQSDYLAMWESFVEEEVSTLLSDHDYDFYEAMAVLRQDCNIS